MGSSSRRSFNKTLPHLSIVFITGHGNVPMSVKAMKGGAVDFLEKPVDGEALLAAIHRAADLSHALRASRERGAAVMNLNAPFLCSTAVPALAPASRRSARRRPGSSARVAPRAGCRCLLLATSSLDGMSSPSSRASRASNLMSASAALMGSAFT
jgi:Response regulator receiver domain